MAILHLQRLLFISYVFIFFTAVAQQNPIPMPPLTLSPTANPTFNNTPAYNTEINPTITCSSTATSLSYALAIALRDYMAPWVDAIKNTLTKTNFELLKQSIRNFLWEYKTIIAANTLAGSYITTSILLISDYSFMNNHQRWSQWKGDFSFEELCAIPQQQLTKELLLAINQRNINQQKPTDINHPLITFISDINNEIYRINRYISIASMQKKLHLIKLFPTNETKIKRAEQLLTRAHFIKHLFLSWLAEYNLTQ